MLKSVNPKSRLWTCLALLAIVVALSLIHISEPTRPY